MSKKIILNIIFYGLVVAAAFTGGLLYFKATGNQGAPTDVPAPETCVITIDGQKYDVQSLRSTHTGGDIFQCGADMSAAFHRKHDDNLQMIQKYLVR